MVDNNRALAPAIDWDTLEKVVVEGDIAALTPEERLRYYRTICESLGLNPATQPFAYVTLKGKLTLYALKGATDQLRRIYRVSIPKIEKERDGDLFTVTAYATTPDGRQDADMGAVSIKGLAGEALANAYLKAITKAKRRVTLSICGLGMLDETEVDSIPGAVKLDDHEEEKPQRKQPPTQVITQAPENDDPPHFIDAPARTKSTGQPAPTEQPSPEKTAEDHQPLTDLQNQQIHELKKKLGVENKDFIAAVTQLYGKVLITDLTRREAADFITKLEKRLAKHEPKPEPPQGDELDLGAF